MAPTPLVLNVRPVPFEPEREAQIRKFYPNLRAQFLRGEPGDYVMHSSMWRGIQALYNFEVKPDDVWLIGFPKSGTTWLQEIVWLINHDCNYEEASKANVLVRVPNFELCFYTPVVDPKDQTPTDDITPLSNVILSLGQQKNMPAPRHFKTHLPFYMLPPNLLDTVKVVYVARNPKDVIVSNYHYLKMYKDYMFNGSIDEFAEQFMRSETPRTSYFDTVLEAWGKRDHPNMHFTFYEDLKSDLRGEIVKIARFLAKELSEEQITALIEHSKFDNCKKKLDFTKLVQDAEAIGSDVNFFRKGKTGDWKNHFSPEMNARLDEWIAENLANTGLSFKMELEKQD